MKLNILVISDIHWGCIDPDEQWKSLEFVFNTMEEMHDKDIPIDLVVIAGDYFDSKLPLNSREAIMAIQWFQEFLEFAYCIKVKRVRMFQGTLDHDNDQLDAFRSLEDLYDRNHNEFFRIFTSTTMEETLPNLKCMYCPDETIDTKTYEEIYLNEILQEKDIAFFHGSFDVVYGELLASKPELLKKKNVIFRYNLFNKSIHGPLIAGHWHDGKQYNELYYSGSPFRYKFNEDQPKGMSFIQYDNETYEYYYQKIINPLCADYITYEVYTNLYKSKEDYFKIDEDICEIINSFASKSYLNNKLRIMIYVMDDKPDNDIFISSLRQRLIDFDNVKITIKNKLKDKLKREAIKKNKEHEEEFKFIYNKEADISETIHDFIEKNNSSKDVPSIEYIKSKITLK